MTHAQALIYTHILPYGRLLALCGVRFDAGLRDNNNPTCPWCTKKLADRKG